MKISPKLKKLVATKTGEYLKILGFTHYKVHVKFLEEDEKSQKTDGMVAAKMNVNAKYLECYLKILPFFVRMWEDGEDVSACIAHEVAHLATDQMHYLATTSFKSENELDEAWESLTERIGRLLIRK